jgi:hypothetical protein
MLKTPVDPRPLLLTDKTGPVHQRSLSEWGLAGNSESPITCTTPQPATPIRTTPNPGATSVRASSKKSRDQCIIPDNDPNRPISEGDGEDEGHFDLMGDGEGDEDDGGEDEDDDEEGTDVNTSKQRVRRSLPPPVKTAYEKNLEYLKRVTGPKSKP